MRFYRRRLACITVLVCAGARAAAQHGSAADVLDKRPAALLPGMGRLHHAVSTRSTQAQKFFDQGLTLAYGFNHEGAYRSFREAARLDPGCAMAYWGMAEALSPNINDDVNMDWEMAACNAIDKGLALPKTPEPEIAYLEAQLLRHSRDPRADFRERAAAYRKAMREVSKRYPNDPDASALYVESIFNLHPWALWTPDRKSTGPDTDEAVAVLEAVLLAHPDHIGANHYYIHALEPSPWPERALASAKRLERLAPGEGHLRHMPSHVYMHTGEFEAAARSNLAAIAADRDYIRRYGADGDYPMYLGHNVDFLRYAFTMAGRYLEAKRAADQLIVNIAPEIAAVADGQLAPSRERYMAASILVQARFYRWNEILDLPAPDKPLVRTTAMWRFARGLAFAALGKADLALGERVQFVESTRKIPASAGFGLSDWGAITEIGTHVLDGKIALVRGDAVAAVRLLREAVALQDALAYDETPDWYYPIRESLGAALVRAGQPAEAESVFRADLDRNPGNGRSLFGLAECLRIQKKDTAASLTDANFKAAWRRADIALKMQDL